MIERIKNSSLTMPEAGHRHRSRGGREAAREESELRRDRQEGRRRLVCGGERLTRDTDGFYMAPALFTETTNDMRINREEVFGPVAAVIRVKTTKKRSPWQRHAYGLSSGIATTSLKYASHFKRTRRAVS
jgi:aldehyde dehydrogenase (NAD+)